MPASDRLARLAALRDLLRRSGYATLDACRSTANHPEPGADAPDIAHLVAAGDPDVLAALFGPGRLVGRRGRSHRPPDDCLDRRRSGRRAAGLGRAPGRAACPAIREV